jgi:phospholipase C
MANQLSTVESIVVLMLENRSLDNLLGFLYAANGNRSPNGDAFDGLTGNESNPDSNGNPVPVQPVQNSTTSPDPDPGEEFQHINMQLFSVNPPPAGAIAKNKGFVLDYEHVVAASSNPSADTKQIMHCYPPAAIPCLAEIIRRYTVCDRWFSSVPTQTWPNRSFAHAGWSNGHVNNAPNNPLLWHIETIFNRMASTQKASWSVYFDDLLVSLTRLQMSQLWSPGYGKNFRSLDDFLHDANAGKLPNYAFLEPNFFANPITHAPATDQHPIHDVAIGDAFIGKVFNAIVSSPQWQANKVLFLITYDEHGGSYDHVPPARTAIPPKAGTGDFGFDFKRYGVRVPAVVVSPYVVKGSVFRGQGQRDFDHTSILATIERRFGIDPLTERDKKAPDLGAILSLAQPRNDSAPVVVPDIVQPVMAAAALAAPAGDVSRLPLNDLQRSMVTAMHFATLAAAVPAPGAVGLAAAAAPQAVKPPQAVNTVGDAFAYIWEGRKRLGI